MLPPPPCEQNPSCWAEQLMEGAIFDIPLSFGLSALLLLQDLAGNSHTVIWRDHKPKPLKSRQIFLFVKVYNEYFMEKGLIKHHAISSSLQQSRLIRGRGRQPTGVLSRQLAGLGWTGQACWFGGAMARLCRRGAVLGTGSGEWLRSGAPAGFHQDFRFALPAPSCRVPPPGP